RHLLERVDWKTDLHFQTCTTIDTLDYSGTALNEGSKLVIAAAGPPRRELPTTVPDSRLPRGFREPRLCLPGILAIEAPPSPTAEPSDAMTDSERFCSAFAANRHDPLNAFPLIILVDDSNFTAQTLNNFLWVTFTRSNPAADIDGIGSF